MLQSHYTFCLHSDGIYVWHITWTGNFLGLLLLAAFLAQIASFIGGIVSLFGIPKGAVKLILWKALVGILASGAMGYVIYYVALAYAFSGC